MSKERIKIKCPAKQITHAFLRFEDSEERDKYIRSANMHKRELRDRKIRLSLAMDAKDRYHQNRLGYTKFCMREKTWDTAHEDHTESQKETCHR